MEYERAKELADSAEEAIRNEVGEDEEVNVLAYVNGEAKIMVPRLFQLKMDIFMAEARLNAIRRAWQFLKRIHNMSYEELAEEYKKNPRAMMRKMESFWFDALQEERVEEHISTTVWRLENGKEKWMLTPQEIKQTINMLEEKLKTLRSLDVTNE